MNFVPIFPTRGFFQIQESFQSNHCIVFLCVNPDPRLFEFAEKIASDMYHVYFSIDSTTYVPPVISSPFVSVLDISREESEQNGYRNSVLWVDGASSRCKALYYFCEKNKRNYDAIWMIEEDVYIPSVNTLLHLDKLYPETDLLTAPYNTALTDDGEWQFPRNRGRIDLPWGGGAVMAIRISPRMIDSIRTFMKKNTTLLMDELLFHTLAMHNNLTITVAPELKGLVVFRNWSILDVKENHLFHPAKEYQEHLDMSKQYQLEHYRELPWLVYQYDDRKLSEIDSKFMERVKKYCEIHQYVYQFESDPVDLPPYWVKVKKVKELLDTNQYQGILWIDTDAVIVDMERTLSSFTSKSMVISRDSIVFHHEPFNAGVWIVKNDLYGKQIMSDWLQSYNPNDWKRENGAWSTLGMWAGETYEQGAFTKHILPKYTEHIEHINWDVFQDVRPNPNAFTLHFAAYQKNLRQDFLDKVKIL